MRRWIGIVVVLGGACADSGTVESVGGSEAGTGDAAPVEPPGAYTNTGDETSDGVDDSGESGEGTASEDTGEEPPVGDDPNDCGMFTTPLPDASPRLESPSAAAICVHDDCFAWTLSSTYEALMEADPAFFAGPNPHDPDDDRVQIYVGPDDDAWFREYAAPEYRTELLYHQLIGFENGLAAFEEMGYPAPYGTNRHYFEVFGCGGGIATLDDPEDPDYLPICDQFSVAWPFFGYPMFLADPTWLRNGGVPYFNSPGASRNVHEVFHTIQSTACGYDMSDAANGWYAEAEAEWARDEANRRSGHPVTAAFEYLGFADYSLLPWVRHNYYNFGAGTPAVPPGEPGFLYQYGSPLPRFLHEFVDGGPALLIDLMSDPSLGSSRVDERLQALLEARGGSLPATMADMAAHQADLDWGVWRAGPNGYGLMDALLGSALWTTPTDGFWAYAVEGAGPGERRASVDHVEGTLPQAGGYNVVRWGSPPATVDVAFDGDTEGGAGSPVEFHVRVVVERAGPQFEYHEVPLDADNVGTLTGVDTEDAIAVFIAVVPWAELGPAAPPLVDGIETFDYTWTMD